MSDLGKLVETLMQTELIERLASLQQDQDAAIVGASARTPEFVEADVWHVRRTPAVLRFRYMQDDLPKTATLEHVLTIPVVDDAAVTATVASMTVRLSGMLFDTAAVAVPAAALARATHIEIDYAEPDTLQPVPIVAAGDTGLEDYEEWRAGIVGPVEPRSDVRVQVRLALPVESSAPAPQVHIEPQEINVQPPEVTVDVHMPEQPAPIVAAAPQVVGVKVEVDRKGNKTYIPIREGDEQ